MTIAKIFEDTSLVKGDMMTKSLRKEVENYIKDQYNIDPNYPWDDTPNFATFKHGDNKKWFALIMDVPYNKFQIDKDETVDVINLKNIPEMIGGLRNCKGVYSAYHMNKEHWISVLLDGTVEKKKICDLIDISYDLTKK